MRDLLRGAVRRHVSRDLRRKVWRALRTNPLTRPLTRVDLEPGRQAPGGVMGLPGARRRSPAPLPAVELTGGHLLAGDGGDLPVVLVLAVGVTDAQLGAWTAEVARAQALTAAFRPLWLTDSADLARVRRYGWAVDTVVSRAAWHGLHQAASYDAYVLGRVVELRRRFRATVLPLTGEAPADGDARTRLWWGLSAS